MDDAIEGADLPNLRPVFSSGRANVSIQETLHFSDLGTGDVLFFSGDDPESSVVSAATDSPWTHTGMVLKATRGTVSAFSEFVSRIPPNWKLWASKVYKLYELERETKGAKNASFDVAVTKHLAEVAVAISMLRNNIHVTAAINKECTSHWRSSAQTPSSAESKELFLWESTTADDDSAQCFITGNKGAGAKLTLLSARVEGYDGPVGRRALVTKSVGGVGKERATVAVTSTTSTTTTAAFATASTEFYARRETGRRIGRAGVGRAEALAFSTVPSSVSSSEEEEEMSIVNRERASLTKTSPAVLGEMEDGPKKLVRKNTTLEIKRILSAREKAEKNPAQIELRMRHVFYSLFANILVNLGTPYEEHLESMAASCCYDDCGTFRAGDGTRSCAYYLLCCFLCNSCQDPEYHEELEYATVYCSELVAQALKDLCVGEMLMLYDPSSKATIVKSARGDGWESVELGSFTQTDSPKSSPVASPRVGNLLLSDPFGEGSANVVGLNDLACLWGDSMTFVDYARSGQKSKKDDPYVFQVHSKDWTCRKLNIYYVLEGSSNGGEENYVLVHQLLRLLLHPDELEPAHRKTNENRQGVSGFLRERTDLSPMHLAVAHGVPFAMSKLRVHARIKMGHGLDG